MVYFLSSLSFVVIVVCFVSIRRNKSYYNMVLSEKELVIAEKENALCQKDDLLAEKDQLIQEQKEQLIKSDMEVSKLKELRIQDQETHEKALALIDKKQESAIKEAKAALALENEKTLKEREEALNKKAAETLNNITSGLDKDIKDMKNAFDEQKKAHTQDMASIRTKFEETASHIMNTAKTVGSQADNLANALKGRNKMQGIFGETILENILKSEGLRVGTDYDKEYWLRDKTGKLIVNEDTSKAMRPDFVLHFPDDTDVLLDSKVSLTALSDYYSAETDLEREDAANRNLESIRNHVKELSSKEYQKYVSGKKTLDYVIMFIPNYGAYQLAKQKDPCLFANSFKDYKVLITTDETLIPFIKLVSTAWVQKAQLENVAEIVKKAQLVVDRIGLFFKENKRLGTALNGALKIYNDNTARLTSSKQNILDPAKSIVDLGVKPSKTELLSLEDI